MILTCGPSHGGAMPAVEIGHGDPVIVRNSDLKLSGFVFSTSEMTFDLCVDLDEDSDAANCLGAKIRVWYAT